jgi:hypothetical protein
MDDGTAWASMLALSGEIGIGIAGFSGVIVALTVSSSQKWHAGRRITLNMLLVSSGVAVFFSLLPFFLFEIGVTEPVVWTIASGLFALVSGGILVFRIVSQRSLRTMNYLRLSITLFNIGLCVVNVFAWQVSWPFLAVVYWQLFVSFQIFTNLLTGSRGMLAAPDSAE